MKKTIIISALILSLSTAYFASPNVSAATAGGNICVTANSTPLYTLTSIQLEQPHTISNNDSTVSIGNSTPSFYSYSFSLSKQGYISIDHTGQNGTEFIICPNQVATDIRIHSDSKIGLAPGQYTINLPTFYFNNYSVNSFTIHFAQDSNWEIEPNDTFNFAQPIQTNKTYFGELYGEYDYFKFELPVSGKIVLSYSTNAGTADETRNFIGLYSYDAALRASRTQEYYDLLRELMKTYQQCLQGQGNIDEGNRCYEQYNSAYPGPLTEYHEGVTETHYLQTNIPSGPYSASSQAISLPAGTYYIKISLLYKYPQPSTYNFEVSYTSNSGIVEKASNLNTSSNITLTSLKGTTLSGATISRPEMVQRLMNQGYKKADAIAAVDSLGIDFSYNAVRQALAIRKNNPKQTFNDITYGLLKTTYNFNNFQRRKARTILARWVATGEIK